MVDFSKFERVLGARAASQIPKPGDRVEDSFQWQEDVIAGIRKWAKTSKLNSIEAFRSFDLDFDDDKKLKASRTNSHSSHECHGTNRVFAIFCLVLLLLLLLLLLFFCHFFLFSFFRSLFFRVLL